MSRSHSFDTEEGEDEGEYSRWTELEPARNAFIRYHADPIEREHVESDSVGNLVLFESLLQRHGPLEKGEGVFQLIRYSESTAPKAMMGGAPCINMIVGSSLEDPISGNGVRGAQSYEFVDFNPIDRRSRDAQHVVKKHNWPKYDSRELYMEFSEKSQTDGKSRVVKLLKFWIRNTAVDVDRPVNRQWRAERQWTAPQSLSEQHMEALNGCHLYIDKLLEHFTLPGQHSGTYTYDLSVLTQIKATQLVPLIIVRLCHPNSPVPVCRIINAGNNNAARWVSSIDDEQDILAKIIYAVAQRQLGVWKAQFSRFSIDKFLPTASAIFEVIITDATADNLDVHQLVAMCEGDLRVDKRKGVMAHRVLSAPNTHLQGHLGNQFANHAYQQSFSPTSSIGNYSGLHMTPPPYNPSYSPLDVPFEPSHLGNVPQIPGSDYYPPQYGTSSSSEPFTQPFAPTHTQGHATHDPNVFQQPNIHFGSNQSSFDSPFPDSEHHHHHGENANMFEVGRRTRTHPGVIRSHPNDAHDRRL